MIELSLQPELLTHPNIPKPLHGMNPRSILGKNWWDNERQIAYKKHGYHCWACGIHKQDAKYHKWLEAHESYVINYVQGIVELKEIVALCYSCHNFIHSGRLWNMYCNNEITKEKIRDIINHGFKVLAQNKLKPFFGTRYISLKLQGLNETKILLILIGEGYDVDEPSVAKWDKWRLVFNGKEYKSKFKNINEWEKHYNKD